MDLFVAALIFGFVLICGIVFIDWLNYVNLQRRLKAERERDKLARMFRTDPENIITGIALTDLGRYVPVVVSESSAPGEALFIDAAVFDHEGEINPDKVVKIVNIFPETDMSGAAINEHLREEESEKC